MKSDSRVRCNLVNPDAANLEASASGHPFTGSEIQTLIYPVNCMIRVSGKLANPDTYIGIKLYGLMKFPIYVKILLYVVVD